jgi:hypothetical protein
LQAVSLLHELQLATELRGRYAPTIWVASGDRVGADDLVDFCVQETKTLKP